MKPKPTPPPPIGPTERDAAICLDTNAHRLVDSTVVAWRHFPPAGGVTHEARPKISSAVARRLTLLADNEYLQRQFKPVLPGTGQAPLAYALGPQGAILLTRRFGIDPAAIAVPARDARSALFIEHTLGCTRAWAALAAGCALTPDVRLEDWIGESALRGGRAPVRDGRAGAVRARGPIPDGTGRLVHENGGRIATARVFLELDRGTETNARVAAKFAAYAAYIGSASYHATYGESVAIVLWVTEGRQRLANTLRTIATATRDQPTLRNRVLGATLGDLTPGAALGPIWTVADTGERRPLLRGGGR